MPATQSFKSQIARLLTSMPDNDEKTVGPR